MEQAPFRTDAEIFGDNPEARVACVLLLDVSGSMAETTARNPTSPPPPRLRVERGPDDIQRELAADSLASKRTEVAVVTFGGVVQTVSDFTTADGFQPPVLTASGNTPMGEAIRQAVEMLRRRKDAYRANGIQFYRPWIFLSPMAGRPTNGSPPPSWSSKGKRPRPSHSTRSAWKVPTWMFSSKSASPRARLGLKGLRFRDLFLWLSIRAMSRSNPGENVQLLNPTGPEGWATI